MTVDDEDGDDEDEADADEMGYKWWCFCWIGALRWDGVSDDEDADECNDEDDEDEE